MFKTRIFFALSALLISSAAMAEERCGWFSNPTPGNAWLDDPHLSWSVAVQGGHSASGDWPAFPKTAGDWIETQPNGYGYGCGCLIGTFNARTGQVLQIQEAKVKSLWDCRLDPAVKALEPGLPILR